MGLDVTGRLVYGFEVKGEAFAELEEEDCDFSDSPPRGLEYALSTRRDEQRVFWYLDKTRKEFLELRGDGARVLFLTPDMHDPLTLRLYDEMILDALKRVGFKSLPAQPAWIVIPYISY